MHGILLFISSVVISIFQVVPMLIPRTLQHHTLH